MPISVARDELDLDMVFAAVFGQRDLIAPLIAPVEFDTTGAALDAVRIAHP